MIPASETDRTRRHHQAKHQEESTFASTVRTEPVWRKPKKRAAEKSNGDLKHAERRKPRKPARTEGKSGLKKGLTTFSIKLSIAHNGGHMPSKQNERKMTELNIKQKSA